MTYIFEQFRAECKALLIATGLVTEEAINLVKPRPNIEADLAFPVFQAAKTKGISNPAEFAEKLAKAIQVKDGELIGKVEAAGAFVNISVAPDPYAQAVIKQVLEFGLEYGKNDSGEGQLLILEFSSPNIARKMHIGHLPSTVIGNSLYRILKASGYKVISDNHLGDWGTQFGTLLAAHELWGWPPEMETNPVEGLVKIYARFHAEAEADPALRDKARSWFKRLEAGDEQARAMWQWIVEISLGEFAHTYERLGVKFEVQHGESFYEPMLAGIIQEALDKGVAKTEEDGAISVSFDGKLPSYLLRKSDGATLYQTRDVATCIYRWQNYAPDRNIYIVGQEQTLHFQQVFETVKRLGYREIADRSVHIAFGAITDPQGNRFSMRKGTAIFLDEVLDEAVNRAKAVIAQKIAEGKTDLSEEEQEEVSQIIGIGAVIYNDLYQDPARGIKFDWDKMLSFEGNSAPYIEYIHARCRSILRKATKLPDLQTTNFGLLTTPEEQAIIKQLAQFPQVVQQASEALLPTLVAEWTYGLAREFAHFYHEHSVLEAPTPELQSARLALVQAVAQGILNGLHLLGIKVVEKM